MDAVHETMVKARRLLSSSDVWVKGPLAVDANGSEVPPLTGRPSRWSLVGAVLASNGSPPIRLGALKHLAKNLPSLPVAISSDGRRLEFFMNSPHTTHGDVLKLLDSSIGNYQGGQVPDK